MNRPSDCPMSACKERFCLMSDCMVYYMLKNNICKKSEIDQDLRERRFEIDKIAETEILRSRRSLNVKFKYSEDDKFKLLGESHPVEIDDVDEEGNRILDEFGEVIKKIVMAPAYLPDAGKWIFEFSIWIRDINTLKRMMRFSIRNDNAFLTPIFFVNSDSEYYPGNKRFMILEEGMMLTVTERDGIVMYIHDKVCIEDRIPREERWNSYLWNVDDHLRRKRIDEFSELLISDVAPAFSHVIIENARFQWCTNPKDEELDVLYEKLRKFDERRDNHMELVGITEQIITRIPDVVPVDVLNIIRKMIDELSELELGSSLRNAITLFKEYHLPKDRKYKFEEETRTEQQKVLDGLEEFVGNEEQLFNLDQPERRNQPERRIIRRRLHTLGAEVVIDNRPVTVINVYGNPYPDSPIQTPRSGYLVRSQFRQRTFQQRTFRQKMKRLAEFFSEIYKIFRYIPTVIKESYQDMKNRRNIKEHMKNRKEARLPVSEEEARLSVSESLYLAFRDVLRSVEEADKKQKTIEERIKQTFLNLPNLPEISDDSLAEEITEFERKREAKEIIITTLYLVISLILFICLL